MTGTRPIALVTGVNGFIGSRLADRLNTGGWQVNAVVRSARSNANPSDINEHVWDQTTAQLIAIVRDVGPDVVFHLASLFLVDHRPDQVADLVTSNILFPAQLTEAMAACGVSRLVNTGTAWQHDSSGGYRPVNLYAATKQACQDLLAYEHDARGLSAISLKLFDTYGVGDRRRKLVQLLVDSAGQQQRLDISPGDQIVDLTHVDDVVEGFLVAGQRLIDRPAPVLESFFLSGERQSVKALVEMIGSALNRTVPVRFGGRPYRTREVMTPADPTGQLLPAWRRQRSLAEALPELLDAST